MTVWHILLLAALVPAPAAAHDAFGDIGPFYASLLHPLADPLQGALLFGTAAFLAGRPLADVRAMLPAFALAAALASVVLAGADAAVALPLLAGAAIIVGLAAMLPQTAVPRWTGLVLVATAGVLTGLAPGIAAGPSSFQTPLGTAVGIAVLCTLAWSAFDMMARRVSTVATAVAGSWAAAIGMIAGSFALT